MSTGRVVAMLLLVIGLVLLVAGMIASDSVGDQLSKTFTGEFTDSTSFMILGGLIMAVIGGVVMIFGGRRSTG